MYDEKDQSAGEILTDWPSAAGNNICVGRIVECDRFGRVFIEFEGSQPKEARTVAGFQRDELVRAADQRREVLIFFEQGDLNRPILVALMGIVEKSCRTIEPDEKPQLRAVDTLIDPETVKIEANKEIVLQCGKGSIKIRKDGKIVVRGTHLVSRSSGANRIKGGHVDIN